MSDVRAAGTFFPSENAQVSVSEDVIGDTPKLFLNVGEIMIVLSEEQARQIRFELWAVLDGLEHDREPEVVEPEKKGWRRG